MTGLILQRSGGFEFRRVGIFDFYVKLDNYRGRKGPLQDTRNEALHNHELFYWFDDCKPEVITII
jgi:hypothetical protein